MGLGDGLLSGVRLLLQTLVGGLLPLWERQTQALERQAQALEALQRDVAALLRADPAYAATLAAAEAGAEDPDEAAADAEGISREASEAVQVELWAFKGWWWQTHGEALDDEAAMEKFREHFQRWPGEARARGEVEESRLSSAKDDRTPATENRARQREQVQ